MTKFDVKLAERFYRALWRIRKTEEEIVRLYPSDKIKSPVHLSIGQEAVSVGVCEALKDSDIVFGTYRGHAMYLAKGGDIKKMIAELYGKKTGCCKGKGGSMHLADKEKGIMGTSAIVGTTIPLAVGYAYALQYRKRNNIVVSFFGDGAVDEGVFHESVNFAALKKLPILFILENNQYAIHSHHLARHPPDVWKQVKKYGIYSNVIEDGNIFKIYRFVSKYARKLRNKETRPVFLECITSRWKEHVGPDDDFHLGYRSRGEVEEWKKKDPIRKLSVLLKPEVRNSIEIKVEKEIKDAFDFAEKSAFPGHEETYKDVFKEA